MKTQIVRIMDCAEVLPGFSTQGALRGEPDGDWQVVMGKHVTQGEPYVYKEDDKLRITSGRDLSRYVLRQGDILFMARGANNYPVLIESVPGKTVAPATFFILTPRPNIVPRFLVWCLEQVQTESLINSMRTGAGTPTIPRKGFEEIEIPLPDMSTQHLIAKLWSLQHLERKLQLQLLEESNKLQRLAGKHLFEKLSTGQVES